MALRGHGFLGVSNRLTTNNQSNIIMENYYIFNGKIIVQLGGMQISREQLDAVKLAYFSIDVSDEQAVNFLISRAENAFNDIVEDAEHIVEQNKVS